MRINTNLAALNAWRALTINNAAMTKSLEKLSSGYRVNRAADDAAGLAVSEKMRAQIRGLNMAIRNAQDGVSMLQTAEGGAQKIQDILQRMRELAVQAANGTLTKEDRDYLNQEYQQLLEEIDRTAKSTTFNKLELISAENQNDKTADNDIVIHIGANDTDNVDNITVTLKNLTVAKLNLNGSKIADDDDSENPGETAKEVIKLLDTALETVSNARANFGAYQNRLESAIQTLQIQAENLTAAESRIRDVDMAQEMANFTKYQILQQASTAMLAQANMSTQSILSLLR